MAGAKQVVRDLLETLVEDRTLEEISYHLYVRAKVEEGLRDLDADRAPSAAQAPAGTLQLVRRDGSS
jgi:hypothetical protein